MGFVQVENVDKIMQTSIYLKFIAITIPYIVLRWPNTSFMEAFPNSIQCVQKDCNKQTCCQ